MSIWASQSGEEVEVNTYTNDQVGERKLLAEDSSSICSNVVVCLIGVCHQVEKLLANSLLTTW